MNLLDAAKQGTWITGTLDKDNVVGGKTIAFGGSETDPSGFVRRQVVVAEDGTRTDALWTHPRWASHGTIKGFLPWQILPAGAVFAAEVGFVKGAAASDGVSFSVWAHYQVAGSERWTRVVDLDKKPTGALVEVRADLSWLAGQSCRLELRVDAGKSAAQDWAIWVAPRIDTREGPAARWWRVRPTQLRIDDRDQAESDGDDPALAAIYFRTTLGHRGSSKVIPRTKVFELGTDRKNGAVLAIPAAADLAIEDVAVAWRPEDLLSTDGVALAGLVLAGIERDAAGDDVVREQVAAKASKLLASLRLHLEPLTVAAILAAPKALGDAIAAVAADVAGPQGVIVSGGGGLIGAIAGLIGHDPVGENRLSLFGIDAAAFDALAPVVGASGLVLDPNTTDGPVAPLLPRLFHLKLHGSGSAWTVDVALESITGPVQLPGGI